MGGGSECAICGCEGMDGLRISVRGVEVVEDKKRFEREFGRGSNVVLVVHEGIRGEGGFERVLGVVESSVLSDEDKEEVRRLVREVEERLGKIGEDIEGLGGSIMRILEKAEWLRPLLSSVVCRVFLEKLGLQMVKLPLVIESFI